MTVVLERMAWASTRLELVESALSDEELAGAERVARALAHENSGAELGVLVIAGRCMLAGYYEMPGVR